MDYCKEPFLHFWITRGEEEPELDKFQAQGR